MDSPLVCPPGKTTPPILGNRPLITRSRLIAEVAREVRHICLQGKIGQGKTIFAAQLYEQISTPVLWYEFDEEDNNALLFCRRFSAAIADRFDVTDTPLPEQTEDLSSWTDLVAHGLAGSAATLTIFFENLHLLENKGATRKVLSQLMRTTASTCRYLVTSRLPVPEMETLSLKDEAVILRNDDLEFTIEESIKLCSLTPIVNESTAMMAIDAVGGWPVMLGSLVHRKQPLGPVEAESVIHEHLHRCFDALLSELSPELLDALYKATFSNHFNDSFISEVCRGVTAPDFELLGDLVRNDHQGNFRLNRALRQYLRPRAEQDLAADTIEAIRDRSIARAVSEERYEEVLELLVQRGDQKELDTFLRLYGHLIPGYRWRVASHHLHEIVVTDVARTPYLQLFKGRFLSEVVPADAVDFIRDALRQFEVEGDVVSELKAMLYLVDLQMVLSKGLQLQNIIIRIQQLEPELAYQLPQADQVLLYSLLGAFAIYLLGDSRTARKYLDQAEKLQEGARDAGPLTAIRSYRAIEQIFRQHPAAALEAIEQEWQNGSGLMRRTEELLLHGVRANYLAMMGAATRLEAHLREVRLAVDSTLLEQSQMGGFMVIWEADLALLRGDYEGAVSLLEEADSHYYCRVEGDVKNQWRTHLALARAAIGAPESSMAVLNEVTAPSPTMSFRYRNQLISAGIHCLNGAADKAISELKGLLELEDDYAHFRTVSHGFSYLANPEAADAERHLRSWAQGIATEEAPRLFAVGYTFDSLARLIVAGSRLDLPDTYRERVRLIARNFMNSGLSESFEPVPFLEVVTSTPTSVAIRGSRLELTRQQRRLIYLVALSKGQTLPMGELADQLWPEAPNSENRLYTMLSRLRKVFDSAGLDPAHYIRQAPGLFALVNLKVDAVEFELLVQRCEQHRRAGYIWNAVTSGLAALEAWSGTGDSALASLDVSVAGFEQRYDQVCTSLVDEVITSPAKSLRLIAALERRHLAEPANLEIAKSLGTLYRATEAQLSIAQLRQRVKDALVELDVDEPEITEAIWAL